MFGLPNKDALSRRQLQWTRELDSTVRSNPSQRALNSESPSVSLRNLVDTSSIISTKPVVDDPVSMEQYNQLRQMVTDLQYKYDQLVQDWNQQQTQSSRVSENLSNRIISMEQSISKLSSRTVASPSSDFSRTCNPTSVRNQRQEFLPFFIREDYAGRDNLSVLDQHHLTMTVEILGHYNEPPIIYPFGMDSTLPSYSPFTMKLDFTNIDQTFEGTVMGSFDLNSDNIYTIELLELSSNGEASSIEHYTFPLIFTCDTDLYPAN